MDRKDNEIRAAIRNNLIALRNEKGYTQADISKFTGKNVKTVSSWEQGISLPDAYTLFLLARHYGVSMDYMYGDPDQIIRIDIRESAQ